MIVYYAHKQCGLDMRDYLKCVVLPILGASVIMLICGIISIHFLPSSFIRLIITCFATTIGIIISALLFAASKEEQKVAFDYLKGLISKTRLQG